MVNKIKEQIQHIMSLGRSGEYSQAEALCQEILITDPTNTEVLTLVGLLQIQTNQKEKGISSLKKSLEISPNPKLYNDLARLYFQDEDYKNAETYLKASLEMEPKNYEALFCLAFSLKSNNKIDEAIETYKKAIELNPNEKNAYHNLGNIYLNYKNDSENTLKYYQKYLEFEPENAEAKTCIGTVYLKLKNYKEGWKNLDYSENNQHAFFSRILSSEKKANIQNIWQGQDLTNKTIYVYYNGGLGDTILFARFLPLLNAQNAKIIFRPQEPLIQLFKDSDLKEIKIIEPKIQDKDLVFDYHIPIMCIPYRLNINSDEAIPYKNGYLSANDEKTKYYKEKYFNTDKLKIGIKWQGDTSCEIKRCLKLESFKNLIELKNTKFYSLQVGEGSEQIESNKDLDIMDLSKEFKDFSDTAAAVKNLDLIICNDTSVAHLACALNKPCWVLLPFTEDWRWGGNTKDSPWYSSARLFKQTILDSWDETFEDVFEELKQKLNTQF